MWRAACFITFGSIFTWAASAPAQDRIVLQQASGTRIPLSGYVEDYNGKELVFRLKSSEPLRRYPRSEIVEVTTEYTPHHDRARKLFTAGKIADAKQELSAALRDEDRPWVRREILASQIKCALWNGDYHGAIVLFQAITTTDPETFHYALIPLAWTDDDPPTNIRFDAREWIGPGSSPLMKLIAASWLLPLADGPGDVEQTLKRLAREPDVRIQRLAQMQLWRTKLRNNAQVDPTEIKHWEQFVEQLPIELRGGSYFVIGQAWKQRHESERAARAYLWLPLVYDSDRWLSSRACFEAAELLSSAGDANQAANLYSEVVFRFGDTPVGPKAETAWKAIQQRSAPANASP